MHRFSTTLLATATLLFATATHASEVFRDLGLEGGLNLSAPSTGDKPIEIGVILRASADMQPEWRLAQWGTRFNLKDASTATGPHGSRTMENDGKVVRILPGGLAGEGVVLGVHGGAEYGGKLRQKGEFWPHLLLEQNMPENLRIAAASGLHFSLSFRLEKCQNATEFTLDPGLHTAQITAYWTVHNQNPASPDHGDMIWFGVPLFDARHDLPPGHQAVDIAQENGKFICTLEGSRFYSAPTGDGTWHELKCDLAALLKEALAASQQKGFLKQSRFEDLYATSFNLGWEVPGPYECEITLKGLSLKKE